MTTAYNETDLLDTRQLAARLGVRPDTVRRWAIAGRIPVYRLGRRILRFKLPEVLESLKLAPKKGGGQ